MSAGERQPGKPAPPSAVNRRLGWLIGAVWLFYLGQPLGTALREPNVAERVLGVAALVVFGAVYVLLFVRLRIGHRRGQLGGRRAWWWLAALIGIGLLTMPAAGADWMVTLVYVAAAAMFLLPPRKGVVVALAAAATTQILPAVVSGWPTENALTLAIGLAGFASFGVGRLAERNARLVAAQEEIARLAVTEERARTARDLHDILGHSLTVIAVKAELAGRLIPLDAGRAATEVAELERLAREALADIRHTAGAYREVTLATELASARSALTAAGMTARLPAPVEDLPPGRGELFGWAVREGVTNVVRHSGATTCTIVVGQDFVEISDDGRGPAEESAAAPPNGRVGGHGLRGLRERAQQAGAQLTIGRAGKRGFRLRVSVPGGTA